MEENENNNEDQYIEDLVEEWLFKMAEQIKEMTPGTEEHTAACSAWNAVHDQWLKQKKIVVDCENQDKQRQHEVYLERMKIEESRREFASKQSSDMIIRKIETFGSIAVPLLTTAASFFFYGSWMNKGFNFEQTGTFTSSTFKNFFRNFRPGKIG